MTTPVWLNDPRILLRKDKIMEIWPSQHMTAEEKVNAADAALSEMMGDAPACPTCGHITVRNGTCYKCLNFGDSLGCS